MVRRKEKNDYRTEIEKRAKVSYYTMSDDAQVRVLDFNLAKKPNEYIILLIPGGISVFQSWQKAVELLSPNFRILYLETREKASSIIPRELGRRIALGRMAYDIKEVVDQTIKNNQKYVSLSSSLAGTFMINALSEKWINPLGAVMVGPTIEHKTNVFTLLAFTLMPNFLIKNLFMPIIRWFIGKFYVNKKEEPQQHEKYVRAIQEANLRKLKGFIWQMRSLNYWDKVPKVETKTLLVGASIDKMHSSEKCLKAHELMRNSIYVDLGSNKATHSEPLVEELKKFLVELEKD